MQMKGNISQELGIYKIPLLSCLLIISSLLDFIVVLSYIPLFLFPFVFFFNSQLSFLQNALSKMFQICITLQKIRRMEKKFIIILVLVSFSMALQLHSQFPAPADPNSPEEKAKLRLLVFVTKNKDMSAKLAQNQDLDENQLKRFVKFMIKDDYFRQQLIDEVSKDEESSWIAGLSVKGQKSFLDIITDFKGSELEKAGTKEKILKRLLGNKQISKALKNKYGKDLTPQQFTQLFNSVLSQGPPLHLIGK